MNEEPTVEREERQKEVEVETDHAVRRIKTAISDNKKDMADEADGTKAPHIHPRWNDEERNDEQAIQKLVETWLAASKRGDLETLLSLMDDDVVFMVPGQESFGKEAFAAASKDMKNVPIEGTSEIQEIKILGDWAWMRNRLKVTITLPDGKPAVRSGYTLTILHKKPNGAWGIARDANLLAPE